MAYLVEIAAMGLNCLCFLCSWKHYILAYERYKLDTKYRPLYIDEQSIAQPLDLPAFDEKWHVNIHRTSVE